MKTEREKAKVFYLVSPWVGYVVASALIIAAIVITLSCIDKRNWPIAGLAWVLAIPISVIVLLDWVRYVFAPDNLSIQNGKMPVAFGAVNISIPRNRLIGIGSIAPILIEQTALYFSDEDGDATFLHLPFPKKKMKEFRELFQETYPEAHFTDEKKSEMFKELFGDKLKDVSIKGKPWRALVLQRLIEVLFFTVIMITLMAPHLRGRSLQEFVKPMLEYKPLYCVGFLILGLFLLYFAIREIVIRARAKDKVFSIYDKGIFLTIEKAFLPRNFLRWKDILSFKRARIYPWIVIKHKDDMGRKRILRIPGHLDDADFSEVKAYVDKYHE